MNDILKIKNMKNLEFIQTPRGCPGLYKFETLENEKRLAVISKVKYLKQRKKEFSLYKDINKYVEDTPKALNLFIDKSQVCILLEWVDCNFMQKIINYYQNIM